MSGCAHSVYYGHFLKTEVKNSDNMGYLCLAAMQPTVHVDIMRHNKLLILD